jgi:hypothetical protein
VSHAQPATSSCSGAAITPPRLRHDSADPIERPDNTEPTLANEPIANAEANDPIDPMERIDPALPIDRIDPFEPIDRIESSDRQESRLVAMARVCLTYEDFFAVFLALF